MAALSESLWQRNRVLAKAALGHPFVQGIGDGSLSRESFAGYIAQDAFFLESFARAYALALAHSPDTATLLTLAILVLAYPLIAWALRRLRRENIKRKT